jgi:acid stress-induced BolA-like protein IbaG/YrbA
MDPCEEVRRVLQDAFQPEKIRISNGEGIIGYIVSPKFREMETLDRQTLIFNTLHDSAAKLSPEEIKQVQAIAALTPEEYIGHGME